MRGNERVAFADCSVAAGLQAPHPQWEEREACVSESVSIIGEKSISQRPFSRLGVMCLWPEQVPQATLSCGEGQEKPSRLSSIVNHAPGLGPLQSEQR